MKPQIGSPNWHWERLGYSIKRIPNVWLNGTLQVKRRIITRPDGSIVDTGDGSHEDELAAAFRELQKQEETQWPAQT